MEEHYILGIHSRNRVAQSGAVQKLLTEYGCNIRTRIGLHEVHDGICAMDGVILLELYGDRGICEELYTKLGTIEGIEVKKMIFTHAQS